MERWKPIILSQILITIVLVVSAFYGGKFWEALTAVGTLGVVGVALYQNLLSDHKKRPIINIQFFEKLAPHLRQTPRFHNRKVLPGYMYPISIGVMNMGRTSAKSASIVISQVWDCPNNHWVPRSNWVPAPVRWALDENNPGRSETKDLVPHRPYVFNLALLDSENPSILKLEFYICPGNQPAAYVPGAYCFALMICAEGIGKPFSKYFYLDWKGGASRNLKQTQQQIKVRMEDSPPANSNREPEPVTSAGTCYPNGDVWMPGPVKEGQGSPRSDEATPSPGIPEDEGCKTE